MNLSPGWVTFLSAAGFEAVHWSAVGAADASDHELLSWLPHTITRSDQRLGFWRHTGSHEAASTERVAGPERPSYARGDRWCGPGGNPTGATRAGKCSKF
ncbi:MAG: hypothetical protein ACXWU5_07745 [Rhodoplanes sp.]